MQDSDRKINILFLCTGNSCRSQMAEGWARSLKGDLLTPYSAGIEAQGLNPLAVKVMAEAGLDISGQTSTHIQELTGVGMDYVVTVCDNASRNCPLFSAKTRVLHVPFEDPPRLARGLSESEALSLYRQVRDEIRTWVETLPEGLETSASQGS